MWDLNEGGKLSVVGCLLCRELVRQLVSVALSGSTVKLEK